MALTSFSRARLLTTFVALALCPSLQSAVSPTYAHDIAPIIYNNCASCHRPGEAGPFSLLSYADVKKHAREIATATQSRYMPPWLPQPGYGEFQDARRLTDEQIKTIADWVRSGTPEGDASQEPALPQITEGWQLGPPDLIAKAPRPFTVPAAGPDVFWNFILKPEITERRFVRAIEIRPGEGKNVHHANVILDRIGSSDRLEAARGVGFAGMDFTVDRNPFDPDSHFLFWKPGSVPYSEPDGFSWRLDPGNELVLNTHLQPTGRPQQIQPVIGLYFTDKPPTHLPILLELEHDDALSIPAGARDFTVSDDFQIPMDVDVLAIYPHAHYLGKLLEAYATLPDGTRKWLIRIPDWDLNWQAVFRYREPVLLPAGSIVSMRFHYDNSEANIRNPNAPPKRVVGGNRAVDEMGHLWLQVLPRGRGDRRRELQEALMQHRLQKDPEDFTAHLNLGAIMLSRLNPQGAETVLQEAVRIDPARPEAHDMLGMALRNLGRSSEAMAQFQLALKSDPTYLNARYNLASALAKSGNYRGAAEYFRPIAEAYPKVPSVQQQYQELLKRSAMATGR